MQLCQCKSLHGLLADSPRMTKQIEVFPSPFAPHADPPPTHPANLPSVPDGPSLTDSEEENSTASRLSISLCVSPSIWGSRIVHSCTHESHQSVQTCIVFQCLSVECKRWQSVHFLNSSGSELTAGLVLPSDTLNAVGCCLVQLQRS